MAPETVYWCVSWDNGNGAARALHLRLEPKTMLFRFALNLSNKSTYAYLGRLGPALDLLAATFRVLLTDVQGPVSLVFPLEHLQYRVSMPLLESGRYDSYSDEEVASDVSRRPSKTKSMQTILEHLCSDLGIAYLYGSGGMEIRPDLFDYRLQRYEKALSTIPFPPRYNTHIVILYFSVRDVSPTEINLSDYTPLVL